MARPRRHRPEAERRRRIVCAQRTVATYWQLVDGEPDLTLAVYRAYVRTIMHGLSRVLDLSVPLTADECVAPTDAPAP